MMIRTDKSLSIRSAVFLMSAVAVARGSSFIFSKQLLAGGMEPLNLLGVRSLIAFAVLMMFFGRRTIESVKSDHHNLTAGALLGLVYRRSPLPMCAVLQQSVSDNLWFPLFSTPSLRF